MRYLSCCTVIEQNYALLWSYPTIHDRYWNTTRIAYIVMHWMYVLWIVLHYIRHLLTIYTLVQWILWVSHSFIHSWFQWFHNALTTSLLVGLYIIYYDFILPVVDLYIFAGVFFFLLFLFSIRSCCLHLLNWNCFHLFVK